MRSQNSSWISLVFLLTSRDWAVALPHHHPMEDAFAGKDVQRACRRDGGVALLCRLEDLEETDLDRLDPCLCSHLIYAPTSTAVSESWRKYSPDVKFLLATSLVRWMRAPDVSGLLPEISEGHFDGVDIVVGEEAEKPEARVTLQELIGRLSDAERLVSLTFLQGGLSEHLLSGTDPVQYTFVTSFGKEGSKEGVPRNKILYGFSMKDLWNDDLRKMESQSSQRCAEVASLNNDDESDPSSRIRDALDKIKHAIEGEKMRGIHIRSLTEDDTRGACGVNSFPTLRFIRSELSGDQEPFGNFADLDIVLSTGESQEVQFLLDLDTPREDLKKLPCERVGFYRHPMDCTKFYHCSEYRASTTRFNQSGPYAGFLYKCPNGLVYDERQGSCIWPSWSDPCRGSGELLPVPAKKFSCVTPGFHVDPENCKYFYYCSDLGDGMLEAFEFLCPSDLLGFDEKKLLCNWKWTVVECSSDVSNKSSYSHKQGNRASKALNLEYIPSLPFLGPFSESLHPGNSAIKNQTSQTNTSLHNRSIGSRNETPYSVQVSNNFIPNEKLHLEKQNNGKFGTAVWQRSRQNSKANDDRRNNSVSSHSSGLELNRATESERPFKGRVIKIDLNGKFNQSLDTRLPNENNNEKLPSEKNPRDFKTTSERDITFENVADRVTNDDDDTPSNRMPSPFINVKCSKLVDKNREHEEVNTLGCTSEVSLTVKQNRENDSSKYILREDQITRSYQESQRISRLKIPSERSNANQNQDNVYESEQKSVSSSVGNERRNMSSRKKHGSDLKSTSKNLRAQRKDSAAADNSRIKAAQQLFRTSYETENFDQNPFPADENKVRTDRTAKMESMPIHFYPQGVLLNINLVHVNQISPDILLEVDYMLKRYMEEGRIDANLLGAKLNASMEEMTPEPEKSPQSEEITDMIRIIENIIKPLEIQEPVASIQNNKTDAANNVTLATLEHDSMTTRAIKPSDETVAPENQTNTQNRSLSSIRIATTTRPFGRGRLFRKFKYPSIRAQLNQQIRFQSSNPKDRSKITIASENPTYSLPSYTYPLTILQRSDKAIRTSFSRLPIHHMPASGDNAIQTPISPFTDRLTNAAHQDPFVNRSSSAVEQNQQDQYLQQDGQSSVVTVQNKNEQIIRHLHSSLADLGLPAAMQNENNQSAEREIQSGVADRSFPVTAQGKNDLRYEGRIPFSDHGVPVTVREKNDKLVQHLHYGLPVTVEKENDQTRNRMNDIRSAHTNTEPDKNEAPKMKENSNRPDEIRKNGEETRPHYTQAVKINAQANGSISSGLRASTDKYDSHENVAHFANDDSDINRSRFSSKSRKLDYPNRPVIDANPNGDEQSASLGHDENDDFEENTTQKKRPIKGDDVSSKQTRKRKKLRILVKKLEDNESKPPLSTDDDPREIEERISKSVLKSLKTKFLQKHAENIELQIQYQGHVWNIPFVSDESDLSPTICTRPGLFQHPRDCNMFYECFWDKWLGC